MKSKFRVFLIIVLVLVIAGSAIGWMMWNKPRRNVEDEKGIALSAAQLVKDYQENETASNTKYLDKAISVTGTVAEVKNNQDGKVTVLLGSDDAFTGVFCTLKESTAKVSNGASVTIKGICSGMLSDVRLREAVVVNK
jgi:uncharacterized protein YpmB